MDAGSPAPFVIGHAPDLASSEVFRIIEPVVLADASLKWSLPESQQERFEEYRGTAAVLCAPGGTKGGHHAFLATAARAAAFYARLGRRPVVLAREMPGHIANRLASALRDKPHDAAAPEPPLTAPGLDAHALERRMEKKPV